MSENLSIHPRNWPRNCPFIGEDRRKKNTAKPPKPGRKRERKLLAKFDARQRAWHALPAQIQKGYRKPGSRKINQ